MRWLQYSRVVLGPARAAVSCRTATTSTSGALTHEPLRLQEVPGPNCYPVVGSLFDMILDKDFKKEKMHHYFKKLFLRYGPVVRVKFPGMPPLVILHNPEDVKAVYHATMTNPNREPMGCVRKIRNEDDYYEKKGGLIAENGEEWYRVSSLLRPIALRMNNVYPYLPQMDQVALDFLDRISSLRDSTEDITADFMDELNLWAFESVCLISMNQRLGCLDQSLTSGSETDLIMQAAKTLMPAIAECEMGSKLWKLYPTKSFKQVQQAMEKLKETSEAVLREVESEIRIKLRKDPNARLTMIEQCLVQPGLTHKDVVMFMIDLIAGGTDTVATMAGMTLYLLAKNPQVQTKLQKEVDKVLGDGAEPLTQDHLTQLTYLKAVVKEANRLMPVTLGPQRTLQEDVRVGNFLLQKGWMVLLLTAFSGWDTKEIQQPQEFLPERWLRHRPYGNIHPFTYLPFSFGTRMCIGRRVAEQEIYTLLARMSHRYKVEWKNGELEQSYNFVMTPNGPLKFTFIDR